MGPKTWSVGGLESPLLKKGQFRGERLGGEERVPKWTAIPHERSEGERWV